MSRIDKHRNMSNNKDVCNTSKYDFFVYDQKQLKFLISYFWWCFHILPLLTVWDRKTNPTRGTHSILQASDMTFLGGRTRRSRIKNTTFRKQFQQDSVVDVQKKTLKWFYHVTSVDNEKKSKLIIETHLKGISGRRRPKMERYKYIERPVARAVDGFAIKEIPRPK